MDLSGSSLLGLVALAVALTSLVVNYLLLREQHDPYVVVYALADRRRPSIVNLVIENIGKGIAHDVRFFASEPIPGNAFGFENAPVPKQMTDGPLIAGIPMLSPGESRVITWGQYGGLKAAGLATRDLVVKAAYRSKPRLRITDSKHQSISRISIKSCEGTDASDHNYDKLTAEALKELVQIARRFAASDGSIRVKVVSEDE
jgi:hypothetical protein